MLELRDVSKRYGALTALSNVSLRVAPGEILGYLGPNGSGKSTTVKLVAGLSAPTHGQILFDGVDVSDRLREYKAHIGYVPEEAHLYTYLTATEYLRLIGRLRGLAEVPLHRRIDRMITLLGLDTAQHALLASFSKGMRQKVMIAAALLHNPRLIILDEPMSGLDVPTSLVLRTVMTSLATSGRVVFYSSHDLDTVEKISTRVIILHAGRVVADDSPASLRTLMHAPSLEDVFSQLAVRKNLDELADALCAAIES